MKLEIFQYSLPFKVPFKTGSEEFTVRNGFILKLSYGRNTFFAEAAPLPGYSHETFEAIKSWLNHNDLSFYLEQLSKNDSLTEVDSRAPSSLRFALDSLRAQLFSTQKNLPLYQYLGSENSVPGPLLLHKTISLVGSGQAYMKQIQKAYDVGYRTFKFKVDNNISSLISQLNKISKAFSDITMRIDANRGWSLLELTDFVGKAASLNIDFIEEPLTQENQTALRDIAPASPIRFAADESIRSPAEAKSILEDKWAEVVILKPMLTGSISDLTSIIKCAQHYAAEIVFTSSLESPLGHLLTAHWAALFPDTPHGLATTHLFKLNLFPGLEPIEQNTFLLGNQPGIGFDIASIINEDLLDIHITYRIEL